MFGFVNWVTNLQGSLFGGDFNLAVWQFFVCTPNLNFGNIASFIAIICT